MPYDTNTDLPASVRNHLPVDAQDIYRKAFNHAWAAHQGHPRREEVWPQFLFVAVVGGVFFGLAVLRFRSTAAAQSA